MSMGSGGIFGNPNIGMGGFGGGIFGQPRKRFGIDALEMGQPNIPPFMGAERMAAPAAPMAQQPEQRWMDGGKFKGRDALGLALGAIGDAFTGRSNTANMILGNQQQRRDMATQQQLMAQQRRQGLEDYRAKKLVDQEFAQPDAPKPGSFEWWSDPRRTPEEKATFAAYRDANTPDEARMIGLPDGRTIFGTMDEIQRIIGGGAKPQGTGPAVGAVEDGFRFRGGNPADPNSWEPVSGGAASNGSGNFRP